MLMEASLRDNEDISGAQKGCFCEQIRNPEYKNFRSVVEQTLKSDFGC